MTHSFPTRRSSDLFDIVIQLGAILAVIVLYWRRFWHVAAGLLGWKQGAVAFTRNILLGFLPSAVIGLFVYKMVKAMLDQPIIVPVMLFVGGVAILLIEQIGRSSCRERVSHDG